MLYSVTAAGRGTVKRQRLNQIERGVWRSRRYSEERLQVWDSDDPTLILGRLFMGRFGRSPLTSTGAGYSSEICGKRYKQQLVARIWWLGSTQWCVTQLKFAIAQMSKDLASILNWPPRKSGQVERLISEIPNLFAMNSKRSSRVTEDFAHYLELERTEPWRARPRRILPAWEEKVTRQVEVMCKNGINHHGQAM